MDLTATKPIQRLDSRVLGMALFLMAETMLFTGLISAALVVRAGSGQWPPPEQPRLPIPVTVGNMLVLLASGAALGLSRGMARPVALALGLGTIFIAVQGCEWSRLIGYGLAESAGAYGGLFYGIVAIHGLHVLGGLGCLLWALRRAAQRRLDPSALTVCRMYWFFVVGVWPFLYALLYF